MPPLTDHQIDAASDAEALVQLLIQAGERLPPRLRERILSFGPAVIPPLVAMLGDDELSWDTAPGEGWAPIHAADLLGELHATEAVEPMLRRLTETDWDTILHDRLLQALPQLGPPALEPLLAARAAATDPYLRSNYASVLAKLGIHDDRIYQILVKELEEDLEPGAMHMADYGDPRALPLLSAALDAYEAVDNDDLMANHVVVEIEEAIKMLGGELTPEQQKKAEHIYALDRPKREAFVALLDRAAGRTALESLPIHGARARLNEPRAARKIGRNDPCPCGSGKKYKKCCLGKG